LSFISTSACKRTLALLVGVSAVAMLPSSASAAALGRRTLQQGMSGQDVRVLQDFLTRAGFPTPIGGDFGPITLGNVKKFEKRHGLGVDGIVDAAFVAKIRGIADPRSVRNAQTPADATTDTDTTTPTTTSAPVRSGSLGRRTLKKGSRGQDVRVLQDYLTRAGVTTPVDGQFGPTTLRAVKAFQRQQGLKVTGVVDRRTVAALRSIGDASGSGGAELNTLSVAAPVGRAKLLTDGTAVAPSDAPQAVKDIIAAGNEIAKKPYVYGGGHGKWIDRGYDCSGSVSYALYRAGLLDRSMPSGDFMSWGRKGPGQWVTIYANGGHMYMVVAGLRFDTSGADPSRWQTDMRSSSGFTVRHIDGL
jgi:peptidoglycan hydrolase-like protein with peptidoglycan-binding domain